MTTCDCNLQAGAREGRSGKAGGGSVGVTRHSSPALLAPNSLRPFGPFSPLQTPKAASQTRVNWMLDHRLHVTC